MDKKGKADLLSYRYFMDGEQGEFGGKRYSQVRERLLACSLDELEDLWFLLLATPRERVIYEEDEEAEVPYEDRLAESFFLWRCGLPYRFPRAWLKMQWFERRIGLADFERRIAQRVCAWPRKEYS